MLRSTASPTAGSHVLALLRIPLEPLPAGEALRTKWAFGSWLRRLGTDLTPGGQRLSRRPSSGQLAAFGNTRVHHHTSSPHKRLVPQCSIRFKLRATRSRDLGRYR